MVIKKKVKICRECEKEINISDDKHVLLGTYTGLDVNDESYFHFECFVKWYNKKVSEKAKNSVASMQNKAKDLFSNLAGSGVLENIGGIGKLKSLLGGDLGEMEGGLPSIQEMFGGGEAEEKPKKKVNNGKTKGKTKKAKVQ